MTTDWSRWHDIDAVFERLLDLPASEREAALLAMPLDGAVRSTVQALLAAAHDEAPLSVDLWSDPDEVREALDPSEQPEHIGPWRIVRLLGRGGMGSVYLAMRIGGTDEQLVALKVLRKGVDTSDVLRRFHDERRILAALRHPHIARLIEGGSTADGRPWLAMEYVDGVDAVTWCHTRAVPARDRVMLVRLLARAVDDAHRRLIVHRDIKPTNVLVTAEDLPKLLDFGIAKMLDHDEGGETTRAGSRLLTPRYAAPEQTRGEPVTTATDVFQLGTLLVELLAVNAVAVGKAKQRQPRALTGDLLRIVDKACHEDPDRRYRTAGAFADDLDRWFDARPVSARPDTLGYRTARFLQRHRWLAPTAMLVSLLTGGWVASIVGQNRAIAAERDVAKRQAARAEEVLQFVVELFRSPDPYTAGGAGKLPASVTVVEAMRMAAKRVRTELVELPDVRAELLGTITDVLLTLEDASALDVMALEAAREIAATRGDTSEAYARALVRVGRSYAAGGQTRAADSVLRAVVAHRMRHAGRLDGEAARALSHLGSLTMAKGASVEAITLLRRADSVFTARRDTRDAAEHLRTMAALGNVLVAVDSLERAAETYGRAHAAAEAWVGPHHPQVGVAQVNYGRVASKLGWHEEAARAFERGLAVLRSSLGPTATTTLSAMNNLANAHAEAGRYDSAANTLRTLVAQRRALAGGGPSEDLAASVQNLGVVDAQRGDTLSAMQRHSEAAALYREAKVDGPVPAFPLLSLGGLLLARGEYERAARTLQEARARLSQFLPASHVAVAVVECRLALSRLGLGNQGQVDNVRAALQRLATKQGAGYRRECADGLAAHFVRVGARGRADSLRRTKR